MAAYSSTSTSWLNGSPNRLLYGRSWPYIPLEQWSWWSADNSALFPSMTRRENINTGPNSSAYLAPCKKKAISQGRGTNSKSIPRKLGLPVFINPLPLKASDAMRTE
jgi:hypothetical protein